MDGVGGKMELRDGGRTGKKDGGGETNKPSSIAPFHCRWVLQPPERSACFSSASDDGRDGRTAAEEESRRGKKRQRFIYRGEEKRRRRRPSCRRFRILDHRHGDQSPGNRVHNGSGSPGNSVVSVGFTGEEEEGGRGVCGSGQPGRDR